MQSLRLLCAAIAVLFVAACGGSAANEPAETTPETEPKRTVQPAPASEPAPAEGEEPAAEASTGEEDVELPEPGADEEPEADEEPASEDAAWELVSDFDGDEVKAQIGSGWEVSTDESNEGRSKAGIKLADGGAEESEGALRIAGRVKKSKADYPFAGAMWWPGSGPMEPANFEGKSEIAFWARGDGREYKLNLYYHGKGFEPVEKTFKAGKDWKRHTFSLAGEEGRDASKLMGVFFGASEPYGKFRLRIDQVQVR